MQVKDKLLNPKEAAEFLGLQSQTLAVWRMSGLHLTFTRVGRSIRYRQSALEEYVQRQTIAAS